jgi:small nuclear ribonucleoprotein (snRNP)-like protein
VQVYLNLVLDEALEEKAGGEKIRIGMVVIRGNAVVMLEVRSPRHVLCWDILT